MKIIKADRTIEKIKYFIGFDKDEWTQLKKHSFNKLIKNLSIVGFRKGHVPLDVAKKHVNENEVVGEAINEACKKAHKEIVIPEAEKQNDVFLDTFSYGIGKIDENIEITCEFNLYPIVTLPDIKKTNLKFKSSSVSQQEIDKRIDDFIKKDTLLAPKESDSIENGDTVIFDFKGFIDGKPFEGGEAKLFELEIGSNQFIPDFEKQMIGLKKGEEKTISVTFPKDYHAPDFAGKKADFELNIRDIKISQKPNVDDEYVKSLNIKDVNNKQELQNFITNQIDNEKKSIDRQINMKLIYDYLRNNAKLSYIPSFLVDKEKETIKNSLMNESQVKGLSFVEFMSNNFKVNNESDINNKLETLAKDNIVLIYSLQKLIKDLNIKLTDSDREEYFKSLSNLYHISIDEIKKTLQERQNIDEIILQNKLIDKIIESNKD